MELNVGKNLSAWKKPDFRPGLFRGLSPFQGRHRLAVRVFLLEHISIAAYRHFQRLGQRIHHRHTNPMQAA